MSDGDDKKKVDNSKTDFSKFRIPTGSYDMPVAQKVLLHVPVRKPSKQQFVRVSQDDNCHFACAILKLEDDDRPYLLSPEIAQSMTQDIKQVVLKLTIDRQGNISLWPVPQAPNEGNDNIWNQTQRDAAKAAETSWIRLTSNRVLGCYEGQESKGGIPEPVWPGLSLDEVLAIAFGSTHVITDREHPAIRKLWGLE